LGTPLNVVSGRAMMIASGEVTGPEIVENGKIIVEQANRMTSYIRTMLGHARKKAPRKAPADVEVCFERVISLMGRFAVKNEVRLEISDASEAAVLEMGELELLQVLTNLVTNAIQAMPDGGTIMLGTKHEKKEAPAQSHVAISVRDRGVGIRKEDLPNIFKPFFTTKTESAGTGLGLSIAQGIVREHGGWIDVESEPGVGSCFTICLPQGSRGGA
jgi:two-component system, NtrC family, sensor kinase